jgi:hypothetical protein
MNLSFNNDIECFLAGFKKEGRSSPTGMYWNDFFVLLKEYKLHNEPDPPSPLILAASGESNASKYFRLSEQLRWSLDHGCLNEALSFLNKLSPDKWNMGSIKDWDKCNY